MRGVKKEGTEKHSRVWNEPENRGWGVDVILEAPTPVQLEPLFFTIFLEISTERDFGSLKGLRALGR